MDDVNVTLRILDKLDKIDTAVHGTEVSIVEIKGDLKVHMSRTSAVEKTNELLETKIEVSQTELNARLNKLEKWYEKWHYLGWLIAGGLGLLECSSRIVETLKIFKP